MACTAPPYFANPLRRSFRFAGYPTPAPAPRSRRRPSVASGWFKLNFGGSFYHDGSGRASIGGVIRDSDGNIRVGFVEPTEHSSVGTTEARALIRGLRLALDNSMGRLVVEGDDLMLVKLLRGEDTRSRITPDLRDEILMLLARFEACEAQHIYREGNQVADALCHAAYHTPGAWKGVLVPLDVVEKVYADCGGVVHERIRKTKVV